MEKDLLSTSELAKILGISRIAVFQKIKSGLIKARKIGRNYVVNYKDLEEYLGKEIGTEKKEKIEDVVNKAIKEYGETFKKLGKE